MLPFRAGCPHREAALAWTLLRYHQQLPGVPIVFGECDPELPFNRSAAILDGMTKTTADVLVISDSDVWSDGIHEAIDQVEQGAPWAIPHDKLHRLSETATAEVLAGAEPNARMDHAERPYRAYECSTVFVARREALEIAPPDPRFVGWGHEEQALAAALRTLVSKPWRGTAPCWHLFHEPQERKTRSTGNDENKALYRRYVKARGRPDAMRALVDESHDVATALGAHSR